MPTWVPRAIILFWLGFAVLWLARGVLHSLRSFFLIILISLFLSLAIEPAVNALERRGLRRGLGTGAVFLLIDPSLFQKEDYKQHILFHLMFIHNGWASTHGSINAPN